MGSTPHSEAARLAARFLDPAADWTGDDDARLRALIDDDEDAQATWRRALVAHRLMVGGAADEPTGFERRRRLEALLDVAAPKPVAPLRWWSRGWGALAAMACGLAVALLTTTLPAGPLDPGSDLTVKGGAYDGPLTGVGLTGVTEAGREYEVAHGAAYIDDWLRLSYSNERPELGRLFVFGLQPGRAPVWYAPLPAERRSLAITSGRFVALDFEIRVAARHGIGPLTVVALFTRRPVSVREVERALRDDRPTTPVGLTTRLQRRLGLDRAARIQILQTEVLPGSRKEATPHGF